MKINPLKHTHLTWSCPTSTFAFKTTRDLRPLRKIIGQDRANEAIALGAQIPSQGYNIYLSGQSGTGKMTTARTVLEEIEKGPEDLYDFCYVHNFKQSENPVLLRFKPSEGRVFARRMDEAIALLKRRIPQLFEEDQFQASRKSIIARFQEHEKGFLKEFDTKIKPAGFTVGQVQEDDGAVHTEIFAVADGKPYQIEELDGLVKAGTMTMEQVKVIGEQYVQLREELSEIGRRSMRLMVEFRRELSQHDQAAVGVLMKGVFDDISEYFKRSRVTAFLVEVQRDILSHLDDYVKLFAARASGMADDAAEEAIKIAFGRYGVNLILDNADTKKAPVIVETSPTYQNLFGTIEKRYDARGFYVSDFSQIKAGAVLRADGGFLIMNVLDLLGDAAAWQALKKVMLHGRLEIHNPEIQFQLTALKPEYIKVNVKVILLGDVSIYNYLWSQEDDFPKMFKVHAEFWHEAKRTADMIKQYARFYALISNEESLLHCDRTGAAALTEYAVAMTESQEKITLQFSYVADLLREASFYAQQSGATLVTRTHVYHAEEQRRWRHNQSDEQYREQIRTGVLLIDTKGSRVGQINGLTVYSTGIESYGKPARITATVSAGNAGIINIEREVDLSGSIHTKGVLILSGLVRAIFSRSQPISFSASIAFEQSYGEIDGDSASAAETIALLSAISNVPVRQDMAITGSINQKGDIQPIGGVNYKITGFFEVCKDRGLTGTQGIVIPHQNVKDLMLRPEIIQAVKKKEFFIYPVKCLEEAVFLMTGLPAGVMGKDELFPANTVFGKVQHNLGVLHNASRINVGNVAYP